MLPWPRAEGKAQIALIRALRRLLTAKYPNQLASIYFSSHLGGKRRGEAQAAVFEAASLILRFNVEFCDSSPQSLVKSRLEPLFLGLLSNVLLSRFTYVHTLLIIFS